MAFESVFLLELFYFIVGSIDGHRYAFNLTTLQLRITFVCGWNMKSIGSSRRVKFSLPDVVPLHCIIRHADMHRA